MNSRERQAVIDAKRYAWDRQERMAEHAFDDDEAAQELPASQEQPHEQKDPQ